MQVRQHRTHDLARRVTILERVKLEPFWVSKSAKRSVMRKQILKVLSGLAHRTAAQQATLLALDGKTSEECWRCCQMCGEHLHPLTPDHCGKAAVVINLGRLPAKEEVEENPKAGQSRDITILCARVPSRAWS